MDTRWFWRFFSKSIKIFLFLFWLRILDENSESLVSWKPGYRSGMDMNKTEPNVFFNRVHLVWENGRVLTLSTNVLSLYWMSTRPLEANLTVRTSEHRCFLVGQWLFGSEMNLDFRYQTSFRSKTTVYYSCTKFSTKFDSLVHAFSIPRSGFRKNRMLISDTPDDYLSCLQSPFQLEKVRYRGFW